MIGEHIEHYRILQHVGGGGMGTVYRALDTMLEREVALKILRGDLSDQPDVTRRFRAEAVTLARLSHPHIATLFGLVRHGPQLCMVMELVPGDTLATLLQREPRLGWERAGRLSAQILSALDYAHRAGIVHRDIKPSNVIVSESGVVKVLDFGIARVLNADRLTRQGLIIGTPQYMAPEQIRAGEVDGRSDVYAVGVLLYEMLAGRLPFHADNEIALMYAHLEGRLVPLAEAAPDTPAWLVEIVGRALERAPEARFPSAAAFCDALEARLPHRTPVATSVVTPSAASEAPTLVPETIAAPAPTPPAPGGFARLRSWMFPRVTWEYHAGPDGMLTVRRALRPRSGAHPQPVDPALTTATPHAARPRVEEVASPRQWAWRVVAIASVAAVGLAAASMLWQDEAPEERRAAASAPVAPAVAARPPTPPAPAPTPTPNQPPVAPAAPPPQAAASVEPVEPPTLVRAPAPGATRQDRTTPTPAPEQPGADPASGTPPVPAAAAPAAPAPAVADATPAPARFTPAANLKDEKLEDVILLVPGGQGGYDEVEVSLTFERDRLVVFDTDEERVVATVFFAREDGPSVADVATWLTGREYWLIVPTTTGRIVLQIDDYRAVSRAAAAFEARTGRPVRRVHGELDR
jgi:hypothetical protein